MEDIPILPHQKTRFTGRKLPGKMNANGFQEITFVKFSLAEP